MDELNFNDGGGMRMYNSIEFHKPKNKGFDYWGNEHNKKTPAGEPFKITQEELEKSPGYTKPIGPQGD